MMSLVTRLEDLVDSGRCLIFASGGLDSTYGMKWAAEHGVDLVALHVDVGGDSGAAVAAAADCVGIELLRVDARDRFARDFVAPAIRAGGLYQGVFPISASLSRPLMAQVAVDVARQIGAQTIIHTAEPHQNSFNRFNVSIALLGPELRIASPFLDSRLDRQAKRAALEQQGLRLAEPVHSVDTNLWCRVIENGSLDDSTSRVPESVFTWSRMTEPGTEQTVRLRFSQGVPVSLDARPLPLSHLVHELNGLAGAHGIGRFDGFEGTPWTAKNREVREAPAAAVILAAFRRLCQVTLTDDELELLDMCAARWIRAAVAGHWFTTVMQTLGGAVERLTRAVTGDVTVVLRSGGAFVSAVHPTHSLALDHYPLDLAAPLSYHRLLMAQVGADLLRNSH